MELRKDYVLDRWAIIAPERVKRPIEHKERNERKIDFCPFCPGNEAVTPTEIYRLEDGDSWKIRVFENKYPVVSQEGKFKIETHNKYFTFSIQYSFNSTNWNHLNFIIPLLNVIRHIYTPFMILLSRSTCLSCMNKVSLIKNMILNIELK